MNTFLSMSDERRRLICEQAQDKLGLPPATIEKDFWVCWILKNLFELPLWGDKLVFKGGTALSKGWALIERFSEDIDIVINRDALGFGNDNAPHRATSRKQARKRLDALKEASQGCINKIMLPLLKESISYKLPVDLSWKLTSDTFDPDGQTLVFSYPTTFNVQIAYLRQEVRIEMGARSDTEPTQEIEIKPYLADAFPDLFQQTRFSVRAVSPERTFWEKAMLLHEETFRPPDKKRKARMARHYYDLFCLIKAGIGDRASMNQDLFIRIAAHRRVYFHYSWVDYDTLRQGNLRLIPQGEQLEDWRRDYVAMKDEMFFGDPPAFDDIIETVREFQDMFNKKTR
ncbi:MAG: nucleotidyl transferase AbiEii/AbiGii toxin family protein [Deltaproteobacteria bacterium]|nr:nucleotidyl transferase AbiEii/AbiGii toxin family protein [Deltaproteobacteria bacterium]